jgi:phosphatidate cytidylyltransferase
MALHAGTFKTRALTSLFFVVIMLLGLLWNSWSFFILLSVIHFGCWREYQQLIGKMDPRYLQISPYHKYGVMLAGWCFMLYASREAYHVGSLTLGQIGFWGGIALLFVLPALEVLFVQKINFRNIWFSLLGLLYISLSLALFLNLRIKYEDFLMGDFTGKLLVLIIVVTFWINDTMAYIIGSVFGKTPLTRISPKKTWEGTLGGIVLSILVLGVIGFFLTADESVDWGSIFQWMGLAAVASVTGTFGDILESKLKRMAEVKDSGQILPGHGGFLDRFDSLLFALPFVWVYVLLFVK